MKRIFTLTGLFFLSGMFFVSAQTIPNSGFEMWMNTNNASNWQENNNTGLTPALNYIRQSTDKYSGVYAAEIITSAADWTGSTGNISGLLTLGNVNIITQNVTGGVPISSKPIDLHGFYKYTPGSSADNMSITAIFTKWMGSFRQTLFSGSFTTAPGQNVTTWTQFTLNIIYNPTTIIPDTFNIILKSSQFNNILYSRLLVDDLAFTPATTGVEESSVFVPALWPNPANDKVFLNLNGEEYNINVTNMIGQNVISAVTKDETVSLNTCGLQTGIYYVNIDNKDHHYSMKLLINR